MSKIELVLAKLHHAFDIKDMQFPGSNLHKLVGDKKNYWSVSINRNWRLTFVFEDSHAYDVDYIDYH